ncbi:condensation domain-containing protein, partial [Massilia aurea]
MSRDKLEQLKKAVLLKKLQQAGKVPHGISTSAAPSAVSRAAPMPLSVPQQRLWFLDQLDRNAGAAYHIPAALRLQGPLANVALHAALDRIVARHEILRTYFVGSIGEASQQIEEPNIGFALVERDLRHLPDNELEAAVARLASDEAATPFDLATGPLVRGQLLRLAQDEHVLLVTQHHIISDGWSVGLLVQEFSALYTAFSQGLADPLPPLTLQYADYAVWQRQWLQGDTLRTQRAYWCEHLAGAPVLLSLPTDRPRPPSQSYAGGRVALTLSAELTDGLRALAKRHGATLFMTLLAPWSA